MLGYLSFGDVYKYITDLEDIVEIRFARVEGLVTGLRNQELILHSRSPFLHLVLVTSNLLKESGWILSKLMQ